MWYNLKDNRRKHTGSTRKFAKRKRKIDTRMTEYKYEMFGMGTIFRLKADEYPFLEDHVDFMLCEYPSESGYAIYCVSGYCKGHIEVVLPEEAKLKKGTISSDWLIKNWNKWVYDKCKVEEIDVIE